MVIGQLEHKRVGLACDSLLVLSLHVVRMVKVMF